MVHVYEHVNSVTCAFVTVLYILLYMPVGWPASVGGWVAWLKRRLVLCRLKIINEVHSLVYYKSIDRWTITIQLDSNYSLLCFCEKVHLCRPRVFTKQYWRIVYKLLPTCLRHDASLQLHSRRILHIFCSWSRVPFHAMQFFSCSRRSVVVLESSILTSKTCLHVSWILQHNVSQYGFQSEVFASNRWSYNGKSYLHHVANLECHGFGSTHFLFCYGDTPSFWLVLETGPFASYTSLSLIMYF